MPPASLQISCTSAISSSSSSPRSFLLEAPCCCAVPPPAATAASRASPDPSAGPWVASHHRWKPRPSATRGMSMGHSSRVTSKSSGSTCGQSRQVGRWAGEGKWDEMSGLRGGSGWADRGAQHAATPAQLTSRAPRLVCVQWQVQSLLAATAPTCSPPPSCLCLGPPAPAAPAADLDAVECAVRQGQGVVVDAGHSEGGRDEQQRAAGHQHQHQQVWINAQLSP